jgi:dephospho-CoA kinase
MAAPAQDERIQPYLIGLTGNIACGKSAVLAALAEHGAATIDADRVVHALMEPGEAVWAAIRDTFGPAILTAEGRIDRRALGAIVFADPAQLARLEGLTHPAVRARIVARLAAFAREGAKVAVVDAIRLYEGGWAERCDETWVVACDPAQQLARLMARNGFSEAEARQRIAAQPPQAEKIARADVVIDNSGTPEATRAQVDAARARLPLGADEDTAEN